MCNSLWPHGISPWNSPGQNTGVGKPFPSPGDLPNPGIEPRSPTLQADSLPAESKCSMPIQFSRSIVSDFLWPHGLQHTRPPCPSPTPRAYSNSCPLSRWCHPTISSSDIRFSSHLQSFPASGSFQISQLCKSGGQSIGASASTSVLPMNTQDWFPLGWTSWISLLFKWLSRVFSNTRVQKHPFVGILYRKNSEMAFFKESHFQLSL